MHDSFGDEISCRYPINILDICASDCHICHGQKIICRDSIEQTNLSNGSQRRHHLFESKLMTKLAFWYVPTYNNESDVQMRILGPKHAV
jgi:hypothetical protein